MANELGCIPEVLGGLTELRVLILTRNKIKETSVILTKLKKLESKFFFKLELDLVSNFIDKIIPDHFEGLNLSNLSLSSNKLQTLSDIPVMPTLTYFGLFGNELTDSSH